MHAFVQSTALGFLKIMIGDIGKKCVCVCVCVCVTSQDGGVEATGSLADSNFGAFAADGLSTLSNQRYSSPSAAGAAFVADRIRFPGNFYAPLDSTCQPHPFTTPPGVS